MLAVSTRLALLAPLLAIALTGCRISDEHFTHVGEPGGGGDDMSGSGGGRDAAPDGMPELGPPATKAYLFDFTKGIYQLTKNPQTGALTVVNPTSPVDANGAQTGATSKTGSHLYALASTPKQIRDFTVGAAGALTNPVLVDVSPCQPAFAALHPSGNFLVVGCNNNFHVTIPIQASGALGAPVPHIGGTNALGPAFSPDGNCLYIADFNGDMVTAYTFDATGAEAPISSVPTPTSPRGFAVHPNGKVGYAAGSGTVRSYGLTADCKISALNQATVGGNSSSVTVDPLGRHLYVSGTEVYLFTIDGTGGLAPVIGSPFLSKGFTVDGLAVDPGAPDLLYVTGRAYGGTDVTTVDASGVITEQQIATAGAGGTTWLQIVP